MMKPLLPMKQKGPQKVNIKPVLLQTLSQSSGSKHMHNIIAYATNNSQAVLTFFSHKLDVFLDERSRSRIFIDKCN